MFTQSLTNGIILTCIGTCLGASMLACDTASAMGKKRKGLPAVENEVVETSGSTTDSETARELERSSEVGENSLEDSLTLEEAPVDQESELTPPPLPEDLLPVEYWQGFELGLKNGDTSGERVLQRTVGEKGCSALGQFESALLQVTRTIRAPRQQDTPEGQALVRGFFEGYLEALKVKVESTRTECEKAHFESGEFAGSLFGSIACAAVKTNVAIATELELGILFSGWSGAQATVQAECLVQVETTLSACTQGNADLHKTLSATVQLSCSDQ